MSNTKESYTIVKDGSSNYTIVVGADASPSEVSI
jgi:hypothetical protein